MSVTMYSFEDADGNEFSIFTTFSATEAREYGKLYQLRVVANEFEYADREVAWDFTTPKEQPHEV